MQIHKLCKPDLIAPGVDIIASWSPISIEGRKLGFNIVSGTSMAYPYVSCAAGCIKSFRPIWSLCCYPISLMTTAKQLSATNNQDAEFAYGAGQIDPVKVLNPNLIYDAGKMAYIRLLCKLVYNKSVFSKGCYNISYNSRGCYNVSYISVEDLNYPSFALRALNPHIVRGTFKRTVTNIGSPSGTFMAVSNGLNISVKSVVLSFTSIGKKKTFILTIDGSIKESIISASLI
ncbi:cucumisin-like [Vicia villosa]|uniref:cucumisin-like n=1 Tax=Vicia villosa TaxID=3911 RepID=UPI00273C9192|nr:cucumisin-like [Vicia villosa]